MVTTQIICWLIFGSAGMLLFSCSSYQNLQIEVLQPPLYPVPAGSRIALLDRGIRWDSGPVMMDTASGNMLRSYFIQGMNHIFTEAGYDTVIPLESPNLVNINNRAYPVSLETEWLDDFFWNHPVDYLVSIELMGFTVSGAKLNAKWLMRTYESWKGTPSDSVWLNQPLVLYGDSEWLSEELKGVFWDAGAAYMRRLVPYWQQSERRIYKKGKWLRTGLYVMNQGNSGEAARIWQSVCEQFPAMAAEAKVNLAWLNESEGNFEAAYNCLKEAEQLAAERKPDDEVKSYIETYLKILRERIKNEELLNNFLNQE